MSVLTETDSMKLYYYVTYPILGKLFIVFFATILYIISFSNTSLLTLEIVMRVLLLDMLLIILSGAFQIFYEYKHNYSERMELGIKRLLKSLPKKYSNKNTIGNIWNFRHKWIFEMLRKDKLPLHPRYKFDPRTEVNLNNLKEIFRDIEYMFYVCKMKTIKQDLIPLLKEYRDIFHEKRFSELHLLEKKFAKLKDTIPEYVEYLHDKKYIGFYGILNRIIDRIKKSSKFLTLLEENLERLVKITSNLLKITVYITSIVLLIRRDELMADFGIISSIIKAIISKII